MNIEGKYLNKLKHYQTFVDVSVDRHNDADYGFIVDFNEEFLLLEKFDSDGNYDGFSAIMRDRISRIRWGGNEINSVSRLIDVSKRMEADQVLFIDAVASILRSFSECFGHVTVHTQDIKDDICYIGEIHDMDGETLVLHEFGTKQSLDRKYIMLSLNDITKVDGGGQYEKALEKLFTKKKK